MIERRVNAAITCQSHEMQLLAVLLSVSVCSHDLRILHDRAVLAGAVNLHEILIYDASGSDIEVSYLRVAHLSVGKTYVLAACLKLRVSRNSREIIQIRCRRVVDNITVAMLSDSPSVENHQ